MEAPGAKTQAQRGVWITIQGGCSSPAAAVPKANSKPVTGRGDFDDGHKREHAGASDLPSLTAISCVAHGA